MQHLIQLTTMIDNPFHLTNWSEICGIDVIGRAPSCVDDLYRTAS